MSKDCKYCKIDMNSYNQYNYASDELFEFDKHIDGKNQNLEVYIMDNPEAESFTLNIDGVYTDIEIIINYCPMCGRKL